MDESSHYEAIDMNEMREAHRVSGANEIFNTYLQTSRVFWLLFRLLGTRHNGNS